MRISSQQQDDRQEDTDEEHAAQHAFDFSCLSKILPNHRPLDARQVWLNWFNFLVSIPQDCAVYWYFVVRLTRQVTVTVIYLSLMRLVENLVNREGNTWSGSMQCKTSPKCTNSGWMLWTLARCSLLEDLYFLVLDEIEDPQTVWNCSTRTLGSRVLTH